MGDQRAVPVVYTVAVNQGRAAQVTQTLQSTSPSSMSAVLQQAFQEAGLGNTYGALGVIGLSVEGGTATTDPMFTSSVAGGEGDADGTWAASAAIAAILTVLFCVAVCSGIVQLRRSTAWPKLPE